MPKNVSAGAICAVFLLSLAILLTLSVAGSTKQDEEDYYKLLGVSKTATDKEIKKAFRKLAIEYHPDKNPDPEARKKFEKIANAYDVLSDPEKRRAYDMFGRQGASEEGHGGGGGGGGTPFDFDAFFSRDGNSAFHHHAHFNFHSMFEDFDSFFGDDDDEDGGFFQDGFGANFFHGHHHPHHGGHDDSFFGNDMERAWDEDDEEDGFLGGFGGNFFRDGFDMHMEFGGEQRGQNCRTVTKRVGNSVSTTTICT